MSRFVLSVMLLFPLTAAAGGDRCAGLVPIDVVATAAQAWPGFRMPSSTDNQADDVAYNLSQGGTGCLGIAHADFDGNGRRDYLIALTSRRDPGAAMIVVLTHDRAWRIERLEEWRQGRDRLFVEAGASGRYRRTASLDGMPLAADETSDLTCRHRVAMLGATESTSVAYCLQGRQWRHVQVSD